MASKRTVFNMQWLDFKLHLGFVPWLSPVAGDKCKGYCKVFHAQRPLHQKNLKIKSSQQSIAICLGSKPSTSSDSKTREGEETARSKTGKHDQSDENGKELPTTQSSMAAYVIKDCVRAAECLWALQVVMKKMSFNSCNNISELFKRMFSDSQIAQQFHLGKTKAMHVVAFGLVPYFSDLLLKQMKQCQTFVICFDEALNKVFQKGQMDLVVLFWDDYCHKVSTRYLTSVFLQTTTDLLQKFQEGMSLSVAKLLQVSMDGPNVNHLFLRKLKEEIKTDLDCKEEGKELIDFGTCSLHVVHGSFKTGLQAMKWDLNSVLHNMYYLFKDSPARRASYTAVNGSTLFPLKFCSTRWLENVKCLDRAMTVFDNIKKYVEEAKLPHSKPAIRIKAAMQDPLMKCKMAFMKTIAGDCEPFLQRFQNQKPLAPFWYEELSKLIKKLMIRCIKSEMLQNVSSGSQLLTIDMKLSENLLDRSKIDIGFSAKKLLKETKLSERQVAEFCLGCRNMVVAIVEKLIERSPLKFKMVRGLSALDPTIISYKPNLGITRIGAVLEAKSSQVY